jgi:hypothetical protein
VPYAIAFLLLVTICGCSGEKEATPEERRSITAVVTTASDHLRTSKRFTGLGGVTLPALPATADYYSAEETLRLVSDSIIAEISEKKAEVLFHVSRKRDSATVEKVDAIVRLRKESSGWVGTGVYIR